MVRFVYYLVLFDILARCSASLLPSINLKFYTDYNNNNVTVYEGDSDLLEPNKPFIIKVISYDKILRHIYCKDPQNNDKYVNKELKNEKNKDIYTVEVQKANQEFMEGVWKCTIQYLEIGGNKSMDKTFQVKFKSSGKNPSEVFVNEFKINTTAAKNIHFEAKGEHWYLDGELANITCENTDGVFMNISYTFQDDDNTSQSIVTKKEVKNKQIMRVKLTEKQNGTYFTCNVIEATKHVYTVRLYFYMIAPSSNHITFKVNNTVLAPVKNAGNYKYEYYDEEILSIAGSMARSSDTWNCRSGQDTAQLKPIEQQKDFINLTVTLPKDNVTSASIDCQAGNDAVHFALVPKNTTEFDPFISGLSSSQILFAYRKNPNEFNIKYSNLRDRALQLTCISKFSGCKWIENDDEVSVGKNVYMKDTNQYIIKYLYKPLPNEPSTIKCKCSDIKKEQFYTTIAEIINQEVPHPPPVTESSGNIGSSATLMKEVLATDTTTPITTDATVKNNEGKPEIPMIMLIGIIVGSLTIVIIVIWIIVGVHKRKRRREQAQQSTINYENLTGHNEGPMATPSQWNTYSEPLRAEDSTTYAVPYVETNIEDMYAQPLPKDQRQPIETLYAEVGAQGNVNYASVMHKAEREPKTEYANLTGQDVPEYSQIQPKKLIHTRPQVLPKLPNDNYAQVLPKSMRMNADASKYGNVFDNQRYANAQAKTDYAEPAYCEVTPNRTK